MIHTEAKKPVIELPAESFSRREDRALPAVQGASLLEAIARAAADPSVDMDKMERLFQMHQKMVAHDAEKEFNAAMSRAQANIQPIVNNAENDHTQSKYADLAAINRQIVPIYSAEGLSISFDTETKNEADPIPEGFIRTIAIVSHEAGHSRHHHIDLPPDAAGSGGKVNKTGVQAAGSTSSYARRYLERMIFNLSTEDDNDGNKGGKVMPEEQYDGFVKKIQAATKKETAKAAWKEAVVICESLGDVATANKLKEVLIAHGKFIDNANKVEA